jgi:hypothetical protein
MTVFSLGRSDQFFLDVIALLALEGVPGKECLVLWVPLLDSGNLIFLALKK